jgi:hypothetical protein
MSQELTIIRPVLIGGVYKAASSTVTVDDQTAADLVFRGDATYVTPPTPPLDVRDDIVIPSDNISDATTVGKAVLTAASAPAALTALGAGTQGAAVLGAATFDALLTALGASLGAADSGGTGYKAIRVPNATT